jgi:hypothetical protein
MTRSDDPRELAKRHRRHAAGLAVLYGRREPAQPPATPSAPKLERRPPKPCAERPKGQGRAQSPRRLS